MLSQEEKLQLFNRLPDLELSYEPRLHKKVYAPFYYIIPKGPKALVWYTYWKDKNVCLLVLLNERGNYSDIKVFPSVFSNQLALGTILYGTYFEGQGLCPSDPVQGLRPSDPDYKRNCQHLFSCEQIHYYKGVKIHNHNQPLLDLFEKHIGQIAYTPACLVVGLPVITTTYEEAETVMADLPYKTYGIGIYKHLDQAQQTQAQQTQAQQTQAQQTQEKHIQAKHIQQPQPQAKHLQQPQTKHTHQVYTQQAHTQHPQTKHTQHPQTKHTQHPRVQTHQAHQAQQTLQPQKARFKVKAALAADTYHLYHPADNKLVGTAVVPTYKSSVLLNSLFRNIKENSNLDLLEESDDETEFENTHLDKFVDLEKTILMECVYLKRFQKWQPMCKI
jgi:hypothetical protein